MASTEQIGRYRVLSELGRGAMGIVYKAQDPTIGRLVAIKTIRLGEMTHPEEREQLRSRLFREAQSAGILNHPGIVTIYDMAEESNLAYIAMEFVDGQTLERILETGAIADGRYLVSVASQTAVALDYAHSRGIIHRDIKPGNIMVTGEGMVKITDFGIARIASSKFTHTGTVMGTPSYMSPEQVRGAVVDGRSDMFSLAVVIYEMLTGQKPFTGESITTIIFKIVSENPVPAKEINPSVGTKMNAVVMRALAKEPAERYQTCREFSEALQAAAAQTVNLNVSVRRVASLLDATAASDPALITQPDPKKAIAGTTAPSVVAPKPVVEAPAKLPLPPTVVDKKLPPLDVKQAEEPAIPPIPVPKPGRRPWLLASGLVIAAAVGGGIFLRTHRPSPPQTPVVASPQPVETPVEPQPPKPSPLHEDVETPATRAPAPSGSETVPPETPSTPKTAARQGRVINVATPEPGALVVVDGKEQSGCTTPCSIPVGSGRHNLLITQAGHYPERREIQVAREPVDLNVALRPVVGTVMIATSPPGAAVMVDGKPANGQTPLTLTLPVGKHVIAVAKDGHAPAQQTVEVTDDNLLSVRMTLPQQ